MLTPMEYEDLQFTAAGLLLTLAGTVAGVLGAAGLAVGAAPAVVLVPAAALLLVSGSALSESRPWSIRLAQRAYPLAAAVWVLVLAIDSTAGASATCAAMAAACIWAMGFLDGARRPPPWLPGVIGVVPPMGDVGWIEELPAARDRRD